MSQTAGDNFFIHSYTIFELNIEEGKMPLIDKDTIKSFLGANSFITGIEDIEGHDSAIKQADNIVYQKTSIPIPEDPCKAIPTLQFCAHSIYIYIVSLRQKLDKDEIERRRQLYKDAISILDDIGNGDFPIHDKEGNTISTSSSQKSLFQVDNCYRSERI
jgi:hypothetical protein